jgi:hypothetical protein
MKFNWQRCIKLPPDPIRAEPEHLRKIEDNLPTEPQGVYFVPFRTSAITIGWFDNKKKLFIPRCAATLDQAYSPKDVFMWAYFETINLEEPNSE